MIYYDDVWDAINQYVRACGGNPDTKKVSAKRLVPVIQQQIRIAQREAFEDGIMATLCKIPKDVARHDDLQGAVDRIINPFEKRNDK